MRLSFRRSLMGTHVNFRLIRLKINICSDIRLLEPSPDISITTVWYRSDIERKFSFFGIFPVFSPIVVYLRTLEPVKYEKHTAPGITDDAAKEVVMTFISFVL